MRSLKRLLGTSLMPQGTVVKGKLRKFEDIIGEFISHMKSCAEQALGQNLDSVVMGRPVHFVDTDPAADAAAENQLQQIARACGFRHVQFQFEPIAAAFAHEQDVEEERLALVVDVGGGTSDFTVIRISKHAARKEDRRGDILGSSGVRIGGNDFDKSLSLSTFMPCFGYKTTYGEKSLTVPLSPFHDFSEWSKINFLYTPRFRQELKGICAQSHDRKRLARFLKAIEAETGHKVLSAVEDAKIALTGNDKAVSDLSFIEEELSVYSTRTAFDESIEPHTDTVMKHLNECLAVSAVDPNDIEILILTGGPTETPLLKNLLRSSLPHASVSERNKLSSVALGLGYDSRRKFG